MEDSIAVVGSISDIDFMNIYCSCRSFQDINRLSGGGCNSLRKLAKN